MKYFAPILCALALAACATSMVKQDAEKADTAASDAYVAIATSLNAYEGVAGANVAAAEGLKLKAWRALMTERQVYATAGTVDMSALAAIAAQAQALTGH